MILLNGELMAESAAVILPLSDGFMTGRGVFTTLRVRAGRAEFFAEHAGRLMRDAQAIGLGEARLSGTLRERCERCLAANEPALNGVTIVWFADVGGGVGELIVPRPHAYGPAMMERGVSLMTVSGGAGAARELSRHKTLNYLAHARAKRGAMDAGFDEALWVAESGEVLEGATTNVFAVIAGEVLTPPVAAGILPGIVRGVVLRLRASLGVREGVLTCEGLAAADEVFVTNSLMGVVPVNRWDERRYDVTAGGVTRELAGAFEREACSVSSQP